jgi:E3 ubiquitin-protein ligase RFWD3
MCSICFDKWTSSGNHRICCLKCGHLFGHSCIDRWLKSNKKCPTCNAKAKKADIRLLYVPRITVVDNHQLNTTLNQLRAEQKERYELVEA